MVWSKEPLVLWWRLNGMTHETKAAPSLPYSQPWVWSPRTWLQNTKFSHQFHFPADFISTCLLPRAIRWSGKRRLQSHLRWGAADRNEGPLGWEPEQTSVLPLQPGAGHARFARCHEPPLVLPVHSPLLLSKSSPCYFTALVLANAVSCVGPPNKIGHSAHNCKWFKPIPKVSAYRIQIGTKTCYCPSIDRYMFCFSKCCNCELDKLLFE